MLIHKLHHFKLKNGIEVVVYPMRSVGAMSLQLGLNAGSALEGKDAGTLHFLEHMLLMGSTKYPTVKDITKVSEELAVTNNAQVGMVHSEFWFYGPSVKGEEIIAFASDLLMEPLFTQDSINKTKTIILDEHSRYWSNPDNQYSNAINRALYGDKNPYVYDSLGTKEKIQSVRRDDIIKLYKKYYHAQNIKISIAGNISITKIKKRLEETFGMWHKAGEKAEFPYAQHKKTRNPDFFVFDQPRDHITFNIAFPIPGSKEANFNERMRLQIASYLFGESKTSLLYNRLRHDLGIVYHVSSSTGRWPYTGRFGIHGGATAENLSLCLREIKKVISESKTKGFRKEDFERGRTYMNMRTYLTYSEPARIASEFLFDLLFGEPMLFPEDYEKIANQIKLEEVNSLFSNSINFDNVFLSLFGDKKKIEEEGIEEEFEKFKDQS